MISYIRRNHLALVALFIALGGTSYAAAKLPRNSVGTKQVINRSLLAKDFKKGQLPRGSKGPKGDTGPTGSVDTANFFTKTQSDARFLTNQPSLRLTGALRLGSETGTTLG